MRLLLVLAVLLGFASPVAAEAPIHLKSLEQQLRLGVRNPETSVARST